MKGVTITKISPVHVDARGEIFELVTEPIVHVALATTKKGAVRGNHYHKTCLQYTYITEGSFEVMLWDADNDAERETVILSKGDLIRLPPRMVHVFTAIEDAVLLEMNAVPPEMQYEFEEDVVRVNN